MDTNSDSLDELVDALRRRASALSSRFGTDTLLEMAADTLTSLWEQHQSLQQDHNRLQLEKRRIESDVPPDDRPFYFAVCIEGETGDIRQDRPPPPEGYTYESTRRIEADPHVHVVTFKRVD